MQANALAEVGKADALAMPRDLFEDCKSAAERLDADPLPVIGVVVDIACAGCTSLAMAALRRVAGLSLLFGLVRGLTGSSLHALPLRNCIRRSERLHSAMPAPAAGFGTYHDIN